MASKFFRYPIDFILIAVSSFLLVFSSPKFDLGFFTWVGLLPLFIVIHNKSLKYAFLLSLVCGMVFFMGIFNWILEVTNYTLLHHALLAVYLGSYFGFFGLVFNFVSRRWGQTPALFAAPFIWVSLEYVRSNLSFLGLPWGLLAHSQYQYSVIIQIASITGTYSISFLIVAVNAALASLILGRSRSPSPYSSLTESTPRVASGALLILSASLMGITLIYGYVTVSTPITGKKVKISLVQGNIEQVKKWDRRYAREIMQIYADLTQEVSKDEPSLIIWPETATPGAINQNPGLYIEVMNIVKKARTFLLLGSAQHEKFEQKGSMKLTYMNSAYLINPALTIVKNQRYDKIRLFPFGEYLPYKEIIPWSLIDVSGSDNYIPGKEFTVFEHPDFRFAVIICWENVFPELVRKFVANGAQFMVNITNEAWFGKTAAPYQLVSMSVFRAVENRVFVIRCANTGVSCIIDPYGRILDRVKDRRGQDIFVRGVMSGWVIPLDSKTFYTLYGDWLVWVALVGTIAFLVIAILKKNK